MTRSWRLPVAAALVAGTLTPPLVTSPASAASGDITAAVLANRDVVLGGDAVIRVPLGTHTYTGVISGTGSLHLSGKGTLVLSRDSTFTLPGSRRHQQVTVRGGNHPYTVIGNPDPPAVTVDAGVTLQYGSGGTTGLIGAFPYDTPGYQQNADNIRVDGTLRLSLTRVFNLGIISGGGLVTQPRNMWGTLDICGTNPFSGVLDNGTGMNFASVNCTAALPYARTILNQGSWIIDTPPGRTVVQRQHFYNREYGSDINVHSRPGSKVILTGSYSWSDRGGDTDPSLSDPGLNRRPVPHQVNTRGTNIEGADVQWGDGTTHEIFMPGTARTEYINLHAKRQRSRLTFDYDGPVTLGAPIGGGQYHDTLSTPGAGDIVIKGTGGNDVTFAAVQFYDGSTTIERHATLHLGSGVAGGDGGLFTKGALDKVVDDGALVIRNTRTSLTLPPVSGSGSLTQSGTAAVTLTAAAYAGRTSVDKGTLRVVGTSLATSSAVALTSPAAVLDLTAARNLTVENLSTVKGAKIIVAGGARLGSIKGNRVTFGAVPFTVTRAPDGRKVLTALTSAGNPPAAKAPRGTSPAAVGEPTSAPPAAAGDDGAETGTGSSPAAWTAVGLAVALCVAAAVHTATRTRRGTGARRRG